MYLSSVLYLFVLFISACCCTIVTLSFGAKHIRASYIDPNSKKTVIVTNELSSRYFENAIFINTTNDILFDSFAIRKVVLLTINFITLGS